MSEYICLHGDCDNYALSQEGCVAVLDEDGRTWICYQPDNIVREVGKLKAKVKQIQAKAYELGFAVGARTFPRCWKWSWRFCRNGWRKPDQWALEGTCPGGRHAGEDPYRTRAT